MPYTEEQLAAFEKEYRKEALAAPDFDCWNEEQMGQDGWAFIAEAAGLGSWEHIRAEELADIMARVDIEVFGRQCG